MENNVDRYTLKCYFQNNKLLNFWCLFLSLVGLCGCFAFMPTLQITKMLFSGSTTLFVVTIFTRLYSSILTNKAIDTGIENKKSDKFITASKVLDVISFWACMVGVVLIALISIFFN